MFQPFFETIQLLSIDFSFLLYSEEVLFSSRNYPDFLLFTFCTECEYRDEQTRNSKFF